jgi:hypothetical protein
MYINCCHDPEASTLLPQVFPFLPIDPIKGCPPPHAWIVHHRFSNYNIQPLLDLVSVTFKVLPVLPIRSWISQLQSLKDQKYQLQR